MNPLALFVFMVLCVLLGAFVAVRLRTRGDIKLAVTDAEREGLTAAPRSFAKVWYLTQLPRPTAVPWRVRRTGSLLIDPSAQTATFTGRDGRAVVMGNVRTVSVGSRGTDIVNTWVEVRFDTDGGRVAYLNDGRWLGWHQILTRSNREMASALAALIDQGSGG